jgi:hypothetical protein
MSKLVTVIVLGSGALFSWLAVDNDALPIPLRLWALIVFMFQVGTMAAVWLRK